MLNLQKDIAVPNIHVDGRFLAVNFRSIVIPLLLAVFAVVVTMVGASWVRGTDQFWYLADAERLLANGSLATNIYLPVKFLGISDVPTSVNHVYHNGPMLHISAWVGKYLGVFNGWITLNLVFHLLNSLVIFYCSSRITNRHNAVTVTSFYLISPIALWQTMNVLQEQYFSAVMAIIVFGYVYRQNAYAQLLLIAGLGLGVISHPIFLILALAYASFVIVKGTISSNLSEVGLGFFILAGSLILKFIKYDIFPASWFPDLQALIGGIVPGKSNIYWFLTDAAVVIDINLMKDKFIDAAYRQFFVLQSIPLYFFTNIALIGILYLLIRKWSQLKWIILPAGVVLGAYVCMVFLAQNSHRYQQIVAPVTFIVIAVVAQELGIKMRMTAIKAILVFFMAAGIYMSYYVKHQSEFEILAVENLKQELGDVAVEANILVYETGGQSNVDLQLGYALPNAKILRLVPEFLSEASISQILGRFVPELVVSNSAGLNIENTELVKEIARQTHTDMYLYSFNADAAKFQVVNHK